ncbi:MAG: pitrilysin family protein [Patescibacteria group bacterium]
MWDPYAEFKTETLPNGLTLHVAHWPRRSGVAIGILVHSGARHDPVEREGVAHFVEHVVFENATVTRKEIEQHIKACGGKTNGLAGTDYSATDYNFFVPAEVPLLTNLLNVYGHMLLNAILERCVEREREIIIGEFNTTYPMEFAVDFAKRRQQAIYNAHWRGRFFDQTGRPDSVQCTTQENLQMFYDAHYVPANISVVCVGGLTLRDAMRLFSRSPFGVDKAGERIALPTPLHTFLSPTENEYRVSMSEYLRKKETTRTASYESAAVLPGCLSIQALDVVEGMLREVLADEVRERRGWTYSIEPSFDPLGDICDFSISCDALKIKALDDVEKVVNECIDSLSSREDLFRRIRDENVQEKCLLDSTVQSVCDGALRDLTLEHRISPVAEDIEELRALTMDDIHAVLSWITPERRWTRFVEP